MRKDSKCKYISIFLKTRSRRSRWILTVIRGWHSSFMKLLFFTHVFHEYYTSWGTQQLHMCSPWALMRNDILFQRYPQALKFKGSHNFASTDNTNHSMYGQAICVEFQRVPLKFHTKYLAHTLNDKISYEARILDLRFKSSWAFLRCLPHTHNSHRCMCTLWALRMHSDNIV